MESIVSVRPLACFLPVDQDPCIAHGPVEIQAEVSPRSVRYVDCGTIASLSYPRESSAARSVLYGFGFPVLRYCRDLKVNGPVERSEDCPVMWNADFRPSVFFEYSWSFLNCQFGSRMETRA